MKITIPVGEIDKRGHFDIRCHVKVDASIRHGFAVFYDPNAGLWSVTHSASGACIVHHDEYGELDQLCQSLSEVTVGGTALPHLSPCDLIECVPLIRDAVNRKIAEVKMCPHPYDSEVAENLRLSWSEYLHCPTKHANQTKTNQRS